MCIRHDYVQRPKIGMCAWMAGWLLCFTSYFAPYVFCTCLEVNVFRVYFIYFTFKSTVKYYVRLVFWCWVMLMLLLLLQLNVIHCVWAHTFFQMNKRHWIYWTLLQQRNEKNISDLCAAFKMKLRPVWRSRISPINLHLMRQPVKKRKKKNINGRKDMKYSLRFDPHCKEFRQVF